MTEHYPGFRDRRAEKREIREIVAQLHHELRRAEDIDPDARKWTEELHREVTDLAEGSGGDVEGLADRLADALAKMGV